MSLEILDRTDCTHQKIKLVFLLVTTLKEKTMLKVTAIEVWPLAHSSASFHYLIEIIFQSIYIKVIYNQYTRCRKLSEDIHNFWLHKLIKETIL